MALAKWLLGVLGFALTGPIGGIFGYFIGSLFEGSRIPMNQGDSTGRPKATPGDIHVALVVLIACVIKADGKVLKSEIQAVKPYLVQIYGEEGALQMLKLLKQALEQNINPESVTAQIESHVNYSTRLEIMHMLLRIAKADGEYSPAEQQILLRIAKGMKLQEKDYLSLIGLTTERAKSPDWAYKALEINRDASNDEVKRAYRRMAMKYHPDKVAGAGEEVVRQATEKFRGIQEAYEHIKAERNL